MKHEKFPQPSSGNNTEGVITSELLKLSNELQMRLAAAKYRTEHSDRNIDLNISKDKNEVMTEWVVKGEAARFAEEYGKLDANGIREALDQIREREEGETLH